MSLAERVAASDLCGEAWLCSFLHVLLFCKATSVIERQIHLQKAEIWVVAAEFCQLKAQSTVEFLH